MFRWWLVGFGCDGSRRVAAASVWDLEKARWLIPRPDKFSQRQLLRNPRGTDSAHTLLCNDNEMNFHACAAQNTTKQSDSAECCGVIIGPVGAQSDLGPEQSRGAAALFCETMGCEA